MAPGDVNSVTAPLTASQLLVGKWLITKDSVQTFDYNTRIADPVKYIPGPADFVVFNKDKSGSVSSSLGFNVLYTDYGRLYINPGGPADVPKYNFSYLVSDDIAGSPPTLQIPDISQNNGVTYRITGLSANSMVLHYETNIAKFPHDYIIKEDIYLSK